MKEGKLKGDITLDARTIDVNPFLVESSDTSIVSTQDLSIYDLEVQVDADRFLYDAYVFENANLKGHLNNDAFELKSLETRIGSSQMTIKGDFNNLSQYVNNEGELNGDLLANSPSFLLNDLIIESDTDVKEEGIVPIPPNLNMSLDFASTKFDYDGIKLDNLNGNIKIKDQVAEIHDASANGLGGKMAFSGSYATPPNEDPSFIFKYDLNQLKFSETFNQLPSVQAFTPILKYMDGFFNSTLIMNGDLGPDLLPKLGSLNASGYIETLNSSLKNFEVVEKLGKKLSLDKLKSIALDNTKNWIEIKDGKLEIKPQKYKWEDIEVMISGSHGLDIAMDYNLIFKIPREKLKSSAIGTVANSGLSMLENEAQKLGVDLSVGDNIDLLVNIGGSMTQPTYNIKPLGSSEGGSFEENIKDAVKGKVTNEVDKAKDSVKTVIKNARVTFKDTVEKTVTKVIDSSKTVINEKINQAKIEAEERAKKEAKRVLDSLANKVVSDSLNKAIENKVIDIIGDKSDKEVDKIKDKLNDFNPFKKKKKKKEN